MSPAIEVRDLRKRFGATPVLDGLTFAVRSGEVFALLGPNGAGKTTTLSILTTLLRPDSGTVTVAGVDVVADPREATRRIALTGQSAAVDDILTARENLVMLARLSGLGRRDATARAEELIDRFDLGDAAGRRVGSYSGGMRRRLDLALSFVVVPQVLFLDEPTTGLDARIRRELWEIIRSLATAGTTVVLTTQYLEEADALADRVAVLHGGRIAATGSPRDLKARIGVDTLEISGDDGLTLVTPTDGTVGSVRAALAAAADPNAIVTLRRPTLDDVFLTLTDARKDIA
jgi:ABC-2 type transport system ATP-binding protein